jgi:hypothetical protein
MCAGCVGWAVLRKTEEFLMQFRLTAIVIAGLLGLGAVDAAQAAHHRHFGHLRHHIDYARTAFGDEFCADRPWSCNGSPDRRETRHAGRHHGLAASDLIGTLQSKVLEIESACGSHLISGYRPGARVAGSGRPSLHSVYPARAADLSGNPGCIYAHLHGWQGGYSTDYGRVRHVHVSYSPPGDGYLGGREWHARFAHYGGGHHHGYASRHHHRLAMR